MNHRELALVWHLADLPWRNISVMMKGVMYCFLWTIFSVLPKRDRKSLLFLVAFLRRWDINQTLPRRWEPFRNASPQPPKVPLLLFRLSMFPQMILPIQRLPPRLDTWIPLWCYLVLLRNLVFI